MTTIDASMTLGELVTAHPELAPELERTGLDYCCAGGRSITLACTDRGIDRSGLLERLAAATVDHGAPEWATMPLGALVDHIEQTHHRFLRTELPRLSAALAEVARTARTDCHELEDARSCFEAFRRETEPHLEHEERVLFPSIRRLVRTGELPPFHCGTLGGTISVLRREHEHHDELLGLLRTVTHGFRPRPGADDARAECYRDLARLEADLHLHLHKENNVLFRGVALAEEGVRRGDFVREAAPPGA